MAQVVWPLQDAVLFDNSVTVGLPGTEFARCARTASPTSRAGRGGCYTDFFRLTSGRCVRPSLNFTASSNFWPHLPTKSTGGLAHGEPRGQRGRGSIRGALVGHIAFEVGLLRRFARTVKKLKQVLIGDKEILVVNGSNVGWTPSRARATSAESSGRPGAKMIPTTTTKCRGIAKYRGQ